MHPSKPAHHPNHISAFDGLRGIAVIMVIQWHYLPATQPFFPGWTGVPLFFVLSGYLITWRLMATKDQPNYFFRFYRNRILRIFPLYYTLVIGFLLAIHFLVQPKNLPTINTYTDHWKSFLIFTQNWTFIFYHLPPDLSLAPLWTIAVEEQFYLIWPAVILLLSRKRSALKTFGCIIAISLLARATAWFLIHPPYLYIYYNTFSWIDSFVIGATLYQLHEARIRIGPGLATSVMLGILAIFLTYSLSCNSPFPEDPFMMTVGYTLLAIFFACLLHLASRTQKSPLSTILNGKLLRGTGRISYCLYLVHLPISQVVSSRLRAYGLNNWPGHPIILSTIAVVTSLILSILVSILSFRYFESPFLALKK